MHKSIATTDLYEAAYYLLNGGGLSSIEGIKINGRISCQLRFSGEIISQLQIEYFHGRATVNLFTFRRAFGHVNALVHTTRKKVKKELEGCGGREGWEGGERE